LRIINNEGIEDKWIIEAKNKLARRFSEGEIQDNSELQGEKTRPTKVKRAYWERCSNYKLNKCCRKNILERK
jgi:hypothetical protein